MFPGSASWTLGLLAQFLVAILCLGPATQSSVAASPASRLAFDVSPVEEGWQQDTVTAIVQSRQGYLWLGTYTGLVRFDGVRFTVFDPGNTPGLRNSRITSLYEAGDGALWIGHETGELTRFAQGKFQSIGLNRSWPGGAVETISADEAGDLWLLNDSGILVRARDGYTLESPAGASPTRKATLNRARDGKLWIASNGTVTTLDQGRLLRCQFDGSYWADFYQAVFPAREGGVWVMGDGRLRQWRDGRWAADLGLCPCAQVPVTVFCETSSGAVLVGTLNDGLYLLAHDSAPVHYSRTNRLSHDWIRTLCEDHEGNIWIGTGGGLDTLRPRKIQMFNAPDNFQGRAVLSFTVRPDGSAWVGTEGAGLYYYSGRDWDIYGAANGLANLFVWSVYETRDGQLLAGTWGGGLFAKNGARFESSNDLARITAPIVSMFESKNGDLWVGTTVGINRFVSGKLAWSAGKEKLVLPDVRAIAEAADGTMWFGLSGGGLASLKDGLLKQYRKSDGLSSDFVLALLAEPGGELWIGTSDNGLCRLKQGNFATVGASQGLGSSLISQIVDDNAGNLWMGSHHGILRASRTDLNRCADGNLKKVQSLSYGLADGLASQTCSGGFQPGACRTSDGQLWFPTTKGLATVDPATIKTNMIPPPVVIEELLVEDERVEINPALTGPREGSRPSAHVVRIEPGRQRFEVRYTALSFVASDKVRFKCKLDGLEKDWTEVGPKRVAQYSYLPPGDYTFRVIACNSDDVWNNAGASLPFMVLPEFWQTWTFRVVALVAGAVSVGGVVVGVTRRRVRRKLDLADRQRAIERERARIARDIHDDLGASLTRITMLCQSARGELASQHEAAADLDQIYATARESTRAMDEIVWAVNPKHDSLDSLVTYLGRFAQNFLSTAAIRCRLDVPINLPAWPLTAEIRHNVFLAFKEALNNVVKHAGASEVRVSLELSPNGFTLLTADNGQGFEWNESCDLPPGAEGVRCGTGNGLSNMQKRLEEIGGRCEWNTAPDQGTRVKFAVPVRNHS